MRFASLLLATALAAAGCGDDSTVAVPSDPEQEAGADGDSADETDTDTVPTTSAAAPVAGEAGGDDPVDDLPGEDDLQPPDDGPPTTIAPPPGYEALCDIGLELGPLVQRFGDLEQDVAESAALYEQMAVVIERRLPDLPDGPVADDSRLLMEGIRLVVDILDDYQGSFGEVIADPEAEAELASVFDVDSTYNEAGDRWDAALAENCGLEL